MKIETRYGECHCLFYHMLPFLIFAIVLSEGKGTFLLAGYNTMPASEYGNKRVEEIFERMMLSDKIINQNIVNGYKLQTFDHFSPFTCDDFHESFTKVISEVVGNQSVIIRKGDERMGILDIKNFSKVYKDEKKAVDNISLSVENGDVFGFIGHNGAGKSTTIKSVVGILDFEEGDIYIDGHSIKKEPLECKSKFAYIPDSPELYEHLTGIQYLNFVADIFGVPEDVRVKRIKEYSGMFGITESLGNLISSYSHGMKQKLAITGAIIHEPKLLILDEPFVGLDPKAVVVLKEIMKKMTDKGNAIFFSTHVLDVAEKLCNKVAMINRGKLVYSGTMDEIIQNQTLEEFFMKELKDEAFSDSSKN